MAVAKPKSDYDDKLGGGLPGTGPGTTAKNRHIDTGVRTAKPPVVAEDTVDNSTASPNETSVTNTRGLRKFEADRYKPRG